MNLKNNCTIMKLYIYRWRFGGGGLILALLLSISVWGHVALAAGVDSLPRKRMTTEVMSLRLTAPKTYYRIGSSYTRGGSSVIVRGGRTIGSQELTASASPLSGEGSTLTIDRSETGRVEPLSMRVAGRTVYFDGEADRFTAVDLTGRVVLSAQHAYEVSLQSLKSGIYILRCERAGVPTVIKVSLR